MYKDDNTWLDADRLPTMDELCDFFKTHDFTTLQVYGEGELDHEDNAGIAYVASVFNEKWDELAREKGLRGHISCYDKNENPLMLLRNGTSQVVSEAVYKLICENPDGVTQIIEQFSSAFGNTEKADELLSKSIDTVLDAMQFSEVAGIVQSVPAHEDFSHKQQNFPAADFDRKWNHSRAKVTVESVDEIDEQTAYAEDVSEIVFANERFANFWGSLSEEDQTILMYSMNNMTQAEIAEKMGFKTHSAVGKRLAKLKQKFIEA